MKKFYVLLAALGLVFSISSCKNTMDLTKRRYTKGYHFEKHTAPATPQEGVAAQKSKVKPSDMEPIAQALPAQRSENKEVKGGLQETATMNAFQAAEKKQAVVPLTRKEEKISNTTISKQESVRKGSKTQQKGASQAKGAGSDVALVLLVILCLFPFINLIPVYLHDDGVTTNFWVTLILDLLFFLPGIIFALLVVLDVVDLA